MSLAALCNWTGTFVTTYPFQQMSNAMTSTGVFAGFCCGILLLGASYLLFFMPGTKGLTLEQINEVFERPVSETLRENVQNLRRPGTICYISVSEKCGLLTEGISFF
jgi:hypothetical protein